MKEKEKNTILTELPEKIRAHTLSVIDEAVKLAKNYGVDEKNAGLAALFHDMMKGRTAEELNAYIYELGLDRRYLNHADLAHSKVAAAIIERDYHITDPDIINAVSYHTTGRAGMSRLEQIVYLADKIDPLRDNRVADRIRVDTYSSLDRGMVTSLRGTIEYLKGRTIDNDTLDAVRYYERRLNIKR